MSWLKADARQNMYLYATRRDGGKEVGHTVTVRNTAVVWSRGVDRVGMVVWRGDRGGGVGSCIGVYIGGRYTSEEDYGGDQAAAMDGGRDGVNVGRV